MALLIKMMGLFWLLAEGLIMVFVRRGTIFLETGKTGQRLFVFFCSGVFLAATVFTFGGSFVTGLLPAMGDNFWRFFYDEFLWNVNCTLWAIIEGVIMFNAYKAFRLLNSALTDTPYRTLPVLRFGPVIFYGLLAAGFACYHWSLCKLAASHLINEMAVSNILSFYIKICGIFWVLMEGAVALIGIKTVLLLQRRRV